VSKAPSAPAENSKVPVASDKKAPTTTTKPQMNPKFKDLKETGQWGAISKNETIAVCIFALLAVAGAAVGIWFALTRDDKENGVEPTRPTQSPTAAPTNIGQQSELFYAFQAINYSDFTYEYQNDLPLNVADYEGLMDDPTATPQERAMSWLLFEDERDISTEVGQRWALASLYFTWQGENWVSAENWLSSNEVCDWEHITCDRQTGLIGEIDLQSNNLVGTIPPEIAMLNTTKALSLRDNQLTGPLPNEVFGAMPELTILYLDNNQLTGTISLSIRDNQVLSKCNADLQTWSSFKARTHTHMEGNNRFSLFTVQQFDG
jgi:hypothetical protein